MVFKKITNFCSKLGVALSGLLFTWSIWQHENLLIWHAISTDFNVSNALPWNVWWNQPSQIFSFIVLTNGIVYDFTLLAQAISFGLLFISLWFWTEEEKP